MQRNYSLSYSEGYAVASWSNCTLKIEDSNFILIIRWLCDILIQYIQHCIRFAWRKS